MSRPRAGREGRRPRAEPRPGLGAQASTCAPRGQSRKQRPRPRAPPAPGSPGSAAASGRGGLGSSPLASPRAGPAGPRSAVRGREPPARAPAPRLSADARQATSGTEAVLWRPPAGRTAGRDLNAAPARDAQEAPNQTGSAATAACVCAWEGAGRTPPSHLPHSLRLCVCRRKERGTAVSVQAH